MCVGGAEAERNGVRGKLFHGAYIDIQIEGSRDRELGNQVFFSPLLFN